MSNTRHSRGSGCAGVRMGEWKYNGSTEKNRLKESSMDASNVPDVLLSQPSSRSSLRATLQPTTVPGDETIQIIADIRPFDRFVASTQQNFTNLYCDPPSHDCFTILKADDIPFKYSLQSYVRLG